MKKRLPPWLRKKKTNIEDIHKIKVFLRDKGLHTVCESARCPNISECFSKPTATFLILGDICTRCCGFCSVQKGEPKSLNDEEPHRIAEAAHEIGLRHVVITSVTRDDLADGGAKQFVRVIKALKEKKSNYVIEVLTPDFKGSEESVEVVAESGPDIYNHNVETVKRLYNTVRPEANYNNSLNSIYFVKSNYPKITTKSGLMLGFGETHEEVLSLIMDLYNAGCDMLTIGQYLRPSLKNLPVSEYVHPDVFETYKKEAKRAGIKRVEAGPFVRSSFNAETAYKGVEQSVNRPNTKAKAKAATRNLKVKKYA